MGYKVGSLAWNVLVALSTGEHLDRKQLIKATGDGYAQSGAVALIKRGLVSSYATASNGKRGKRYHITPEGTELLKSMGYDGDVKSVRTTESGFVAAHPPSYGSIRYMALSRLSCEPMSVWDVSSTKELINAEEIVVREALLYAFRQGWANRVMGSDPIQYVITPEGEDVLNKAWEKAHGN